MGAGQANATTFVQYEARGTGFELVQTFTGFDTKLGDFIFDFVIGMNSGSDSSYSFQPGQNNTFSASVSLGKIKINGQNIEAGGHGPSYSATIDVPSYQVFSFGAIPTPTFATGLVDYDIAGLFGATFYSGSITSLVKVGTVAGFIQPTVSVLPEVGTWAMMILGMGVIGFAMRRKQKVRTSVRFA
jgi:hypothetical protein